MQDKKTNFLLDVYSRESILINNINFTPREKDIMACLLNARGTSKIAYLLEISPKTVSRNIENIRSKMGCNSREGIIDFIERSNKQPLLRTHYSHLLIDTAFTNSLKKIAKLTPNNCLCSLVFWKDGKNPPIFIKTHKIFLETLKDHFELAGINTIIERVEAENAMAYLSSHSRNERYSVYILPRKLRNIEKNDLTSINATVNQIAQNLLFLFVENESFEEMPNNLHGIDCFDFTDSKNYYYSFFEILKKFLPHDNLQDIIEEFKSQCEHVNNPSEITTSELELSVTKELPVQKAIGNFLKLKISYFTVGFIAVVSILSAGFFIFRVGSRENSSLSSIATIQAANPIYSDLTLPTDEILLNRSELIAEINNQFKGHKEGIQTLAFVGIGGAGKTTIARHYARQQKANVIWEINAETKGSLKGSFEKLALVLSKTERDQRILRELQEIKNSTEKEEKIISFVKEHLKLQSPWFLIFDNVENFSDIEKYFPHHINSWGKGKIILTTRNFNIQNNNSVDQIIQIGELSKDQKLNIFMKIMNHGVNKKLIEAQKEEMRVFLENVPPFPLDVSIAAHYLKTTNISYARYLDKLKNYTKETNELQENILKETGEYTKTRYAIITYSLENLIKKHKDFVDLFLLISFLDSQNIPKDLLDKYKNPDTVDNFIYHLKKHSLITSQTLSPLEVTYSLHRSTQAISLAYLTRFLKLNKESPVLKKIVNLLHNYSCTKINKEEFSKMKIMLQHLDFILKNKGLLNNDAKGTIKGDVGIFLLYLSQLTTAQEFLKEALKLVTCKKENQGRIARYSGYLGNSYRELGDYKKAKFYLEKSLHIFQKLVAEEEKDLPWILVNLGILYRYMEDYQNAKIYTEKALDIKLKLNLNEETHTAWVLGNLAGIYRGLGNNEKAQDLFEKSLAIYEKNYDTNHPKKAWTLLGLGTVFRNLSDFEKAKAFIEKALEIYRVHFSEDNLKISIVLLELAQVHLLENKLDAAETLLHNSLVGFKKNKSHDICMAFELLGELYLKKYNSMLNIGDTKKAQIHKVQAIRYFNQALENIKYLFPINSPQLTRIEDKLKTISCQPN